MLLTDFMFPGPCSLSAIFVHLPVTCENHSAAAARTQHGARMTDNGPRGSPGDRGLADDGTIRRGGSRSRRPAAFTPVVETARARFADAFDATQLHFTYLYGSIPRGTAIPGVSDPDLLLTLRAGPTEADRATARSVEAA
ncbi:hypothetical protein AB0N06_28280 [Streptomyces sp. NPDC051020]|uniref:hypothetical protein n=1 Tax=Streptomyces sp. NPDC051020 TaxID=3155409 RepID=UPI00344791FC